ncbi:MAG: hypothetical protein IPK73_10945 [Candidatus Obscuribacter sp.]|nr:hypothetical protein [Candidatus Obscuribacter sp.]MBK9281532.1 hypothetical protein [Candidatus Obscuribacter sp.]
MRADQCYTQLLKVLSEDHPDYAECLECLVVIKKEVGDTYGALEYNRRLVRLGENLLGQDHPGVRQWRKEMEALEAKLLASRAAVGLKDDSANFGGGLFGEPKGRSGQSQSLDQRGTSPPRSGSDLQDKTVAWQPSGSLGSNPAAVTPVSPGKNAATGAFEAPKRVEFQDNKSDRSHGGDRTDRAGTTANAGYRGASRSDSDDVASVLDGEKPSKADTNVYVSAEADNESESEQSRVPRRFQLSDQDLRDREEMFEREARERTENVVKAILVCLTTAVMVSSIYYLWIPFATADVPSALARTRTSADGLRSLRYLSNKTVSLGYGKTFLKVGFSGFGLGLDDFCRSVPSSVFNKELWLQERDGYLVDEDGTPYYDEGSDLAKAVNNAKFLGELGVLYFRQKKSYPAALSDFKTVPTVVDAIKAYGKNGGTNSQDSSSSSSSESGSQSAESSASSGTASGSSTTADAAASTGSTRESSATPGAADSENGKSAEGAIASAMGDESTDSEAFTLLNPFTSKEDRPSYLAADLDAGAGTNKATLDATLANLRLGALFPSEPPLKAGSVAACFYQVKSKKETDSVMVVHVADKQGKLVRGNGPNMVYLNVSCNGEIYDSADKTSSLGRSILGLGPRLEVRQPYCCVLSFEPEMPLPLWLMRFRTVIPALVLAGIFAGLGMATGARINRLMGLSMAGLSVFVALLSVINAILP